jgi:diacylglycerol kinase (ATP)
MAEAGRVVVVANPTAGRGKAGRLIGRVDRILKESGVPHAIRVSESAEHLTRLAREAAEEGAGIVAALGGDGTISNAANGLLGTGAALATLPSGTADDFAKSVGMGRLESAARQLVDPRIEPVDVVRITNGSDTRHYVNLAGAGFDSDVNETANAMRVDLGATGTYVAAVIKTLPKFQPATFRIELDDEPALELAAMLVVVGNSISYGGGMRVTPQASVVDGVLDVCIVEAMSRMAFLRAFPKVFRGTHVSHPKVRMANARKVRIEADRRVQVYADGERVGPLPAVFEIQAGALPVVIGPGAVAVR